MLLLGAALGLFQLPLIVGVQSTVGWAERGTTTASVLFCRQIGQTVGAALFGAVANTVLAGRLGGAGSLDSVAKALEDPASVADPDRLRRAVAAAVDSVYVGAACAAALALIALLCLAPRRFPVIDQDGERGGERGGERSDEATPGADGNSVGSQDAPRHHSPLSQRTD
jgi:hypothetical protein